MPRPRSYLFVPGNRPERFAKALASGADAVVLDLEDAVASDGKEAARQAVAAWLPSAPPMHVRINSVATPWFEDDLQMCCEAGVHAIVLPKAEHTAYIADIAARTRGGTRILPMIETALGMWNAMDLARSEHVDRLVFGAIDFQLDLSISADNQELLYFRSQLVLVSRVAGLAPPVDGVTTALDNAEQVRADAMRAKRMGFAAKCCIHPAQVRPVNACFGASPEELSWARRVIDAAGAAQGAAIAVDGQMVDKPVLARAEAILVNAVEHLA